VRKRTIFNDAFDSKTDLELHDRLRLIKNLYQNGMLLILASSHPKLPFWVLTGLNYMIISHI
jgi:hypothetical protein